MAGLGVVLRDENGQVIASMAEKVSLLNFVATAIEEALAIVKCYFCSRYWSHFRHCGRRLGDYYQFFEE